MATAIHQYEDKLLDFAYGELPAPEASAVESHVKSCPRCTQALAQIKGVRTQMAALPQVAAPDAGLESLLAYAEQAAARNAAAARPGAAPWWRRMVAPLAGACALALVVIVAVQGEKDGMGEFSKKAAMENAKAEAAKSAEERRVPAPVVAAAPEPAKNKGDEGGTNNDRVWDATGKQNALARNNDDNYNQALGATPAPSKEQHRQQAQTAELGDVLKKQSKTKREADYGNARGGYVQEKAAKAAKPQAPEAKEEEAALDFKKADTAKLSTKDAAPPPPQAAPAPATIQPAPKKEPPAELAQGELAEDKPMANQAAKAPQPPPAKPQSKPSMGFGLSGPSGGSGSASTGSTGSYGGAYGTKPGARDNSDDDAASRGTDQMAERKRMDKDVEGEQRRLESEARPHLEAARSASMQSNHQEEVKQSLYVLQTGVKGAPRAEALSRLCSALMELGNEGQADKYCDALIAEFPNTAAAKVAANKRKEQQRATAKKSARESYSADEGAAPAKPKKAAPADSKPASAVEAY